MYFGDPFVIDLKDCEGSITIKQPTIGDLVKIGENTFFSTLNIFITNTTSYRLFLWEAGIDWNVLSDFELFTLLYSGINKEVSDLLFENIDFSKFELYEKQLPDSEDKVKILYDSENKIEINEEVYQYMHQYIQTAFNMKPEEEFTKDAMLKKWWIQKDKRKIERNKETQEESSSLQSLISACVNHPGFKYKLSELREIGICQFYDSVKRLQVYESTTACMKGMYSGFVDGSKMKSDDYNFMKEI